MAENIRPTYEDEIDLRAILQTLWKARLVILICTLVPALAAFAVSSFRPAVYQASAIVFIGNPPANVSASRVPDIGSVIQLATAPGLLESVTQEPSLLEALEVERVGATDVGRDLLRLEVTDANPERAALLANAWAEKVVTEINANYYGLSDVDSLEAQAAESREAYEQAQAALEEALSKSQVDVLTAQLQSQQSDLTCILNAKGNTARLLEDLQALERKWEGVPGETSLSFGEALALTVLHQRSLASPLCQSETVTPASEFTLQIDGASFANFTISEALTAIADMRSDLQLRLTRLQTEQQQLEAEIPKLQARLEKERASLAQFAFERDQAYEFLADILKQQHTGTALEQNTPLRAVVSAPAVTPKSEVPRNMMRNTLLAGMLGLVLCISIVLVVDWWGRNKSAIGVH